MKKIVLKKMCCISLVASLTLTTALFGGCGKSDAAGTGADSAKGLTEVNFVSPTALASLDLAWLYAADGMGYFEDEGIKLNLIESTDGSDPKILASGQADLAGFAPAVGMSAVDSGMSNVKAICNIVGNNHFGIAYNLNSGIKDWSDLEGEGIGFLADSGAVIYNPIIDAAGVDSSTVNYVNYGASEYEALDSGKVKAMGTWLSEFYMCEGMGYKWGYLSGDDVLPQIANSLWVNTEYATKNPDTVNAFVRAVVKGMYFMYLNPEAVADIILARYPSIDMTWDGAVGSVNGNLSAMFGMTDEAKEKIISSNTIGQFDMDKVSTTMQNLHDGGATKALYTASDYYTNDYLPGKIDYDAIAADSDAYKFTSTIYKDAQ